MAHPVLHRYLLTTPLPVECTAWDQGWLRDENPPLITDLVQMRARALQMLFDQEDNNATAKWETAEHLFKYASAVHRFAKRKCDTRRTWPLQFSWCFPCENMTMGGLECTEPVYKNIAVMKSSYPAFEAICSGAACISVALSALTSSKVSAQTDTISTKLPALRGYIRQLLKWVPDIAVPPSGEEGDRDLGFTRAQWTRLARQAMPIQLHRWWLEFFDSLLVHRVQLQAAVSEAETANTVVSEHTQALFRGSCRTAYSCVMAARVGIHRNPYLTNHQVEVVQKIYDTSMLEYTRLASQTLVGDIVMCMNQKKKHAILARLFLSLREKWAVLTERGFPVPNEMEQWYAKVKRIFDTGSPGVIMASAEEAEKWQASLPVKMV